ncbi:MAG TPA: hypothetical protein VJY62_17290 [Bacteroidia bacterium]|nr:hypothetical protein [Bacteroidia bacterium]
MNTNTKKEIMELVIARLQTLHEGKELSIGGAGEFTRDELIEHVKKGDEIGKKVIDVQMNFLQLLKEGIFYAEPQSIGHTS